MKHYELDDITLESAAFGKYTISGGTGTLRSIDISTRVKDRVAAHCGAPKQHCLGYTTTKETDEYIVRKYTWEVFGNPRADRLYASVIAFAV